jgi:hypothetical protein
MISYDKNDSELINYSYETTEKELKGYQVKSYISKESSIVTHVISIDNKLKLIVITSKENNTDINDFMNITYK